MTPLRDLKVGLSDGELAKYIYIYMNDTLKSELFFVIWLIVLINMNEYLEMNKPVRFDKNCCFFSHYIVILYLIILHTINNLGVYSINDLHHAINKMLFFNNIWLNLQYIENKEYYLMSK